MGIVFDGRGACVTKRPFRVFHAEQLLWRHGIGAAQVERGAIVPPDGSPRGNGCDSTKGDVSRAGGNGPDPDTLVRYGAIDRALVRLASPTHREALRLAYGDAGAIATNTWERMSTQWRAVAHLTSTAVVAASTWEGRVAVIEKAPKATSGLCPCCQEVWCQKNRDLAGPAEQRLVRSLYRLTPRQLGPEGRTLAVGVEKAGRGLLCAAEDAYALSWGELHTGEKVTAAAAAASARDAGARMAWSA